MQSERWPTVPLRDIASNQSRPFDFSGKTSVVFVNTGDVLEGKFLHTDRISPEGLPGQAKKAIKLDDILYSEIRPGNGRFAYVDFDAPDHVVSTKFMVIRASNDIDPRFLYFVLSGTHARTEFQRIADSRSGTFPQVTFDSIGHYPVPLPPMKVQREIVRLLDTFEQRLDLLWASSLTLESIAQAIFKSWFVDHEPVLCTARGRALKGVPGEVMELFPSALDQAETGLVPRGWKVGTLEELTLLNPESWSAKSHPESVRYVELSNVKNNRMDQAVYYPFADAPSRARRVLRRGDTIVGVVRPGNRSFALIDQDIPGLTGSTGFAVLRPKSRIYAEFVYLAATSDANIDRLANVADGGAYPAVKPELVQETPIVIPPQDIMSAFSKIVAPLFDRLRLNQSTAETLASIREAVIPRLVSGQMNVRVTHEALEEAIE